VNEENAHDTQDFINKRLAAIKNQRNAGEVEELALVIGITSYFFCVESTNVLSVDGKSLSFALEKELSKTFLELAIMCKAVICCACSSDICSI
jgi:phospholipid-transporting ATPase